MFSTLVAWLIGKIRCKHDFVVTALPYIDNSYRSMIESVRLQTEPSFSVNFYKKS